MKDPTGATLATYGYDPFGRRMWKETGGTRTYFVYSEEGLVAELDATGNLIQSYGYIPQSPYGTAPLYTRTQGGYAYYCKTTPYSEVNATSRFTHLPLGRESR